MHQNPNFPRVRAVMLHLLFPAFAVAGCITQPTEPDADLVPGETETSIRVEVQPSEVIAAPGGVIQFHASLQTEDGQPASDSIE